MFPQWHKIKCYFQKLLYVINRPIIYLIILSIYNTCYYSNQNHFFILMKCHYFYAEMKHFKFDYELNNKLAVWLLLDNMAKLYTDWNFLSENKEFIHMVEMTKQQIVEQLGKRFEQIHLMTEHKVHK